MKAEYLAWIQQNYPSPASAELMCEQATEKMLKAFPELTRVPGEVMVACIYEGEPDEKTPHWWLTDPEGLIVDPTAHQFIKITKYLPIDPAKGRPIGRCMNCGEMSWYQKSICSKKCEKEYEDYLGDIIRKGE